MGEAAPPKARPEGQSADPRALAEARGLENAAADAEIDWLIELVSEIRSVRSEMNVPAGARVPLLISGR